MGVISQLEDGHFYLEDLSASVEIDLSKAKITTGFFTEHTIVVAEGEMLVDGIFQVITCGFPPLEVRDQSLKLLAGHDIFGGGTLTKEDTLRLADLEKRAVNDMFVILSDIWLDNEERRFWESWRLSSMVLRVWRWFPYYLYLWATSVLTLATSPFIPFLVLSFDFLLYCNRVNTHIFWCKQTQHPIWICRLQFDKLGQMIAAHPRLKGHSQFLFIPGPSTVLPRCDLLKYLTEEIRNYIPNAIF